VIPAIVTKTQIVIINIVVRIVRTRIHITANDVTISVIGGIVGARVLIHTQCIVIEVIARVVWTRIADRTNVVRIWIIDGII